MFAGVAWGWNWGLCQLGTHPTWATPECGFLGQHWHVHPSHLSAAHLPRSVSCRQHTVGTWFSVQPDPWAIVWGLQTLYIVTIIDMVGFVVNSLHAQPVNTAGWGQPHCFFPQSVQRAFHISAHSLHLSNDSESSTVQCSRFTSLSTGEPELHVGAAHTHCRVHPWALVSAHPFRASASWVPRLLEEAEGSRGPFICDPTAQPCVLLYHVETSRAIKVGCSLHLSWPPLQLAHNFPSELLGLPEQLVYPTRVSATLVSPLSETALAKAILRVDHQQHRPLGPGCSCQPHSF